MKMIIYNAPRRAGGLWTAQLRWLRELWLSGEETAMYSKEVCSLSFQIMKLERA